MNKKQKSRLYGVIISLALLASAVSFILYALKSNINVFVTPKQIASANIHPGYHFRLGGLVKKNSVMVEKNSLAVDFIVTDTKKDISVHYVGVLPDLFREGTGVIAEGNINNHGVFEATQVLAKHDENYMPKNVYKSIRENV